MRDVSRAIWETRERLTMSFPWATDWIQWQGSRTHWERIQWVVLTCSIDGDTREGSIIYTKTGHRWSYAGFSYICWSYYASPPFVIFRYHEDASTCIHGSLGWSTNNPRAKRVWSSEKKRTNRWGGYKGAKGGAIGRLLAIKKFSNHIWYIVLSYFYTACLWEFSLYDFYYSLARKDFFEIISTHCNPLIP